MARDMRGGEGSHYYLGFLMDEVMSGMAHQDRAIAMGHSHASKVGEVPSRLGAREDMDMLYGTMLS